MTNGIGSAGSKVDTGEVELLGDYGVDLYFINGFVLIINGISARVTVVLAPLIKADGSFFSVNRSRYNGIVDVSVLSLYKREVGFRNVRVVCICFHKPALGKKAILHCGKDSILRKSYSVIDVAENLVGSSFAELSYSGVVSRSAFGCLFVDSGCIGVCHVNGIERSCVFYKAVKIFVIGFDVLVILLTVFGFKLRNKLVVEILNLRILSDSGRTCGCNSGISAGCIVKLIVINSCELSIEPLDSCGEHFVRDGHFAGSILGRIVIGKTEIGKLVIEILIGGILHTEHDILENLIESKVLVSDIDLLNKSFRFTVFVTVLTYIYIIVCSVVENIADELCLLIELADRIFIGFDDIALCICMGEISISVDLSLYGSTLHYPVNKLPVFNCRCGFRHIGDEAVVGSLCCVTGLVVFTLAGSKELIEIITCKSVYACGVVVGIVCAELFNNILSKGINALCILHELLIVGSKRCALYVAHVLFERSKIGCCLSFVSYSCRGILVP